MTADPRLLIPLAELPGFDPAGLVVYGALHQPSGWPRQRGDSLGWAVGPTLSAPTSDVCRPSLGRLVARPHSESDEDATGWWEWDDEIAVSLADAATRDRLLRWLAGRVGLEVGCGAPTWRPWERQPGERAWEIDTGEGDQTWSPGANGWTHRWLDCPALADLDPTDDTRLPDGSRLVDALALAAVVRAQVST